MKFGLEDHIIEKITQVLEEQPKVDKAYIFGSRAKGNSRPESDIDIALKGFGLNIEDMLKMSAVIEKLATGYDVDLVDYDSIKEQALKSHVDRIGVEFYTSWKKYKIGEIVDLEYGKALQDYQQHQGAYDVFGTNGKIGKSDKYIYDKPSIIIGRKGAYREVYFSKYPFYVIDTAFFTRNKIDCLDTSFLYYWFKNVDINEMDSGSAIPSTSRDEVYDLAINLPPFLEQKKISAVLRDIDNKIDLLHRQNKTLESMAEALFRQRFIEEAKDDWDEKSLTQIANYLNGIALQNYPERGNGHLPVIKIREMKHGNTENADLCDANIPPEYVVNNGDILFSWSGSLEIVIWGGARGGLNQHLFKVTSKEYPKWFCYFATKSHLEHFRSIAESKSTTMGHIQRHHLENASIRIPPKVLFQEVNGSITPLLEKYITNNRQIASLISLRDSLLPKLLSGEARLKPS